MPDGLAAAVARPRLLPEWAAACGGAALLVAVGAVSAHDGGKALRDLGPTIGFLAALLAFHDSGLSFTRFAALMALPTLGAIGVREATVATTMALLPAGAEVTVLHVAPGDEVPRPGDAVRHRPRLVRRPRSLVSAMSDTRAPTAPGSALDRRVARSRLGWRHVHGHR